MTSFWVRAAPESWSKYTTLIQQKWRAEIGVLWSCSQLFRYIHAVNTQSKRKNCFYLAIIKLDYFHWTRFFLVKSRMTKLYLLFQLGSQGQDPTSPSSQPEKQTFREQFTAPEMSIVSKLMIKVSLSPKVWEREFMSPVSPIFHIVSTVNSWSQTCSEL